MPNTNLPIALYDRRENEASMLASYPALRAFSPVSFAQANFPTQVTNEAELRRYADVMHETLSREEWTRSRLYSRDEAGAIARLSGQIEQLTARLFGKPVQPLMCLFPPVEIFRVVEHLAATVGRRLTIFEIGPGSGYLAAYLLNAGHRLIAVDICQSLYLWQNRLFGDYDLDEWAAADVGSLPARRELAQVTHIPWWQFAYFHLAPLPLTADIVICDNALGEMEHFGFRYVVNLAKLLIQSSDIGCLLYQNLGEQRVQQGLFVEQYTATLGFRLCKLGGVSVLVGSEKFPLNAIEGLTNPPLWGGAQDMKTPAQFLPLDQSKFLESYAFFDFIAMQMARGARRTRSPQVGRH